MNVAQPDLDAMKETVTEFYPDFFTRRSKWSKWTLENVFNIITHVGNDEQLVSYLTEVSSYMGSAVVDELRSARADYVEYDKVCSDNRLLAEEASQFLDKYIAPLLNLIAIKPYDVAYLRRQRFSIMAFIKDSNFKPLTEWESATKDVQQLIRRARELYYGVVRDDVDGLIGLLSDKVNAEHVKFYCADRTVGDAVLYIHCDTPDFASIEPSIDDEIKAARMRTGAIYQADPHDLMGKIVVPFAVAKHKLSKANMDILHDRLGQFISAIMRMDSNIATVFADCEPVMRDMAVDVANAYRTQQYSAKVDLERHVLLAVDDNFGKEILQYYIPAVLAYVVGKSEECDVPAGKLRSWLDQARKEHKAIEQHTSISKEVLLDWGSTMTKEQAELMEMFRIDDRETRDAVIKQLRGYNVTTLLAYVRGEVDYSEQELSVITGDLLQYINRAKSFYHNDKRRKELNKGAKNMAMTINYHGRLEVADNALKGTLTLSIDGELAIVDVVANYGEPQVRYSWETLPKVGYDTTLHSQVVWLGHDAAVNIIVVVYKDGGIASTVTFTKDLSGVVL